MPLFIDTWGWLALRDEKDPGHTSARDVAQKAFDSGEQLYTTNFVLCETITAIYGNYGGAKGERILDELLGMIKECRMVVEEITVQRFANALKFRRRYRDKPDVSFTDLTSMVVMRELGIADILSADRHFSQVNLGFRLVPDRR